MNIIISVVSPVYNAETCVSELCSKLHLSLSKITNNYEIILVDDRSSDRSWELIEVEAKRDSRVKGFRLTRNFGQHRAITAGLDLADGLWIVVMDCDLQDPPEVIPDLYRKAQQGYSSVIARFVDRQYDKRHRQLWSKIFWKTLSASSGFQFDPNIGNFRIISRSFLLHFRKYREELRLFGAISSFVGSDIVYLEIVRPKSGQRKSSYTFKKLASLASDILVAYSDKPLKGSIFIGFIISLISIAVALSIIATNILGFVSYPGWSSLIISIYFLSGLIIAIMGINGLYISKIFDETRKRPLYLIDSSTTSCDNYSLVASRKRNYLKGGVIWITGLSGSGKSTISLHLYDYLKEYNCTLTVLDGDILREFMLHLGPKQESHSRGARLDLALRYAKLSRFLSEQGHLVIIATISMFDEVHSWNRAHISNYLEVFVDVPIEELKRRDPKQIYKRFDAGDLNNVSGLDLEVDYPRNSDIVLKFEANLTSAKQAELILNHLLEKSYYGQ